MQLKRLVVFGLLFPALLLVGCSKKDDNSFEKADHNKDGKVIFEELIILYPDLTVEEFMAADSNRDGVLDPEEYKHFREARDSGKKLTQPAAPAPAAQPAAPAPAPAAQPATPATPAAPAQPAPAAPSGQETAKEPTASAAPAAAPAQDQTVEVVPAPEPAPAAKPAATTYVVQRGDTLSRIAAKFGVSAQDIMTANGMKNADKLSGGATITIPGPASPAKAASPAVTSFLTDFFAKSTSGDVNGLLDLYAPKVNYYGKGAIGSDVVRQDKVGYFSRWSKRTYTLGPATASEPDASGELRVSVPVAYTVSNGAKTLSGDAVFTFVLRSSGNAFHIVGEASVKKK